MKTANMRDKEVVAKQYRNSLNLDIRKNFHKKYGTNPIAYPDWILSSIKFFKGCHVLEIGCGTGSLWENHLALVDTFAELVLADISKGMLDIAKRNYVGRKNIKIQTMDILDIPFEDNSFDIIIANSMLYHITDLGLALRNIRRSLKSTGVFYATTFGKGGLLNYINDSMFEMNLSDTKQNDEISFTLENGNDILQNYFSVVKKEVYDDHLEVLESLDLVEYIFSMSSMFQIDTSNRDKMNAYFESKKDNKGILTIPKRYGMFISVK